MAVISAGSTSSSSATSSRVITTTYDVHNDGSVPCSSMLSAYSLVCAPLRYDFPIIADGTCNEKERVQVGQGLCVLKKTKERRQNPSSLVGLRSKAKTDPSRKEEAYA